MRNEAPPLSDPHYLPFPFYKGKQQNSTIEVVHANEIDRGDLPFIQCYCGRTHMLDA